MNCLSVLLTLPSFSFLLSVSPTLTLSLSLSVYFFFFLSISLYPGASLCFMSPIYAFFSLSLLFLSLLSLVHLLLLLIHESVQVKWISAILRTTFTNSGATLHSNTSHNCMAQFAIDTNEDAFIIVETRSLICSSKQPVQLNRCETLSSETNPRQTASLLSTQPKPSSTVSDDYIRTTHRQFNTIIYIRS